MSLLLCPFEVLSTCYTFFFICVHVCVQAGGWQACIIGLSINVLLCRFILAYFAIYAVVLQCSFSYQVTAAKCRLARDQTPNDPAVDGMKFIPTGVRNVFTLVKKFSSSSTVSDLSHSEQEKSPLPGAVAPDKFSFDLMGLDYRPKRTLDRTQSFTDRAAAPTRGTVQRGESMRNPISNNCQHKEIATDGEVRPGRVVLRRRKPVVNHNVPDDELATILNRRSHYLENYEAELASSSDGCSSAEKSVNNFEMQLAQRKCRAKQPDNLGNGQPLTKDASRVTRTSSAEHVHGSSVMSAKHCTAEKPLPTSAKDVGNGQVKPVYGSRSEDGVNCSPEKNFAPSVRQLHSQDKSCDSHVNKAIKKSTADAIDPSTPSVLETESRFTENKSKSSIEATKTPQELGRQRSSKESNVPSNTKLPTNSPTREKPLNSPSNLVQQTIPSVPKKEPEVSSDSIEPSTVRQHEPTASSQPAAVTRSFRLRKTSSMECDIPSSNQKPRRRQLKRSRTIASSTIDPELAEALSRRREKTGEKQEEENGKAAGEEENGKAAGEEENGKAAGDNRSVNGVLSRVSFIINMHPGRTSIRYKLTVRQ